MNRSRSTPTRVFPYLLIQMLLAATAPLAAQQARVEIPTPSQVLGFEPGTDYEIADYAPLLDYYRQLAAASPRVELQEIGQSTLGKPLLLLIVSSEENLSRLDRWREISETLARARVDEETARDLAAEGRGVVWIDAGLHATERAPAQMMPLLAHHLATDESAETRRWRDQLVMLLMPEINPDGLDIVANWYQQNRGTPWETTSPPELYHHYVGHDNNRDWFMNNMAESQAVSQILYREWYPQIVYNHHQTGPAWARIFLPPFADPVNPNIHPGVTTGVNLVGSAMANRFAMEGMPGVVSDMIYSMWWNGGLRTVPYFHNMIGILTETSHSTPTPRYYDPEKKPERLGSRRGSSGSPMSGTDIFHPFPWQGGESHFRDAVDYTFVASLGVLDVAAQLREKFLLDIYRMGRDAIEAAENDRFAYVVPMGEDDQWDPAEAAALVDVLWQGGVEIERAEEAFEANDQAYAAGSWVISGAQAFRPYIVDLLEEQRYPDRRSSPDGPPDPPYDLAGWTLPMQMGVRVDRIDRAFSARRTRVEGPIRADPEEISGQGNAGFLIDRQANASTLAANRLMSAGATVSWLAEDSDIGGRSWPAGTLFVEHADPSGLAKLAAESGLEVRAAASRPGGTLYPLTRARVGLYKSWAPSMDEGWTRWLLESYGFEIVSLTDSDMRSGDLTRFDAIVLPHQSPRQLLNGHPAGTMPEPYTGGLGLEGTLALQRFVDSGGTLIALDEASDFAIEQFGLPLRNAVAETSPRSFFIPGSLVRTRVETDKPLAFGMQDEVAASFVRSRAFEIVTLSRRGEGGLEETLPPPPPPVEVLARYAEDEILMSGWALGAEEHIGGKIAAARVQMGAGQVVLVGFRCQFRGQPRSTYKLLFNALQGSTVEGLPWQIEPLEIENREAAAETGASSGR